MTKTILLKTSPISNPQEVQVRAYRRGNRVYIQLGDQVSLGGDAALVANLLRWLTETLTPPSVGWRQAHAVGQGLPEELAEPETAWPWLVQRFPWLFDGIDTNREPYAHYLRKSAQRGQIESLQADLSDLGENPSLADISEVVYGSRYYSGSQYAALKKIKADLTSSDSQNAGSDASEPLDKAA